MRTSAAACSRLASSARATFPSETWLVVVRVIATRIPAPLSSAARRLETARLTTASGVVTHTPEAVVNLAVSKRLAALLKGAGIRVAMTRTTTSHVSMGNVARAQLANRLHAAAFVRIHCDGSTSGTTGTHTLYPVYHRGWTDDIYKPSLRLATLVQAERVHQLGLDERCQSQARLVDVVGPAAVIDGVERV